MTDALSATGKRWSLRSAEYSDLVSGTNRITGALCRIRNIDPHYDRVELADPHTLPGIESAIARIHRAFEQREHVAIFGDYDCDGICSTAQLARFFCRHGINPTLRLPHRVEDGYGLKSHIVRELLGQGITLLITVDNGISSAGPVAEAQNQGMDVIITDHHAIPDTLPLAQSIVHPGLAPSPHPTLCGAGVVYQLIRALEQGTWRDQATDSALAMIGTVADLVDLKGNNRSIVIDGLRALSKLPDAHPITILLTQAGVDPATATSTDIAFRVAPRINAAGRMDNPHLALDGLLGDHTAIAALDELNRQRQELVTTLYDHVVASIDADNLPPLIAAVDGDYTEGVVGLLAGKLTQQFGRPSLVGTVRADECTASLRSIPSVHITDALTQCKDLLSTFGGHAQAGGCTFDAKNLDEIVQRMTTFITSHTTPDTLVAQVNVDLMIDSADLTLELCERLSELEPFGQGNPVPLFLIKNVRLENARSVGHDGAHLSAQCGDCKVIGFGLGKLLPLTTDPVDLVFSAGIDTWNNTKKVQLTIEDIRRTSISL